MTNSPRQVRIDEDDLQLMENIKANRPNYHHEKDLKAVALKRGLRLLAAEATLDGPGQYGGLNKRQLARELRQMILPILDFLAEANELPAIVAASGNSVDMPAAETLVSVLSTPAPIQPEPINYERNMQDLRGVMTSLDDDDDDDDE
ncbi:hypothetical protein [Herpetosiphon giganteus]|uniref:hypothetical protein n=1 Tax=Herpetosiphon giganteus TaxID=2029754 RepID=UPI001956D673|nr:hypothetical protein [Herpetosiphon giganteus]MBM7846287.1 hypothetical protein [Herpetosiphon giganteus]